MALGVAGLSWVALAPGSWFCSHLGIPLSWLKVARGCQPRAPLGLSPRALASECSVGLGFSRLGSKGLASTASMQKGHFRTTWACGATLAIVYWSKLSHRTSSSPRGQDNTKV